MTSISKQRNDQVTQSTQLHSMKSGSQRLGISPRTLQDMIAKGEIASVRVRYRVFITEQAIEKYIREHTVESFDAKKIAREVLGGN